MNKSNKHDNAMSEVIGVILMVVIVTILASITALFVYSYLQSTSKPYIISFVVTRVDPNTIRITNNGGPGLGDLKTTIPDCIKVKIDEVDASPSSGSLNHALNSFGIYNANIGSRVVITGLFIDGTEHTLYDGKVS